MALYVLSVRGKKNSDEFGNYPASPTYLMLDDDASAISPKKQVKKDLWIKSLIDVTQQANPEPGFLNNSDILFFIHGYNNSEEDVLRNHKRLRSDLKARGFKGEVVSFDWPSGNSPLAYLPDRNDARATATQLLEGAISILSLQQSRNCTINVHVLAHSTGAFVVREAFTYAEDDNKLEKSDWNISQLVFISGDVSSRSMAAENDVSRAIYNHCARYTNYFNPYDAALALSNVKRVGYANRVGRVGLPVDVPASAVDVDCGDYFSSLPKQVNPFYSHSWYFGDPVFMDDLYQTLTGLLDRNVIPTRRRAGGMLLLQKA